MKIVFLDRNTIGDDIDIGVFKKYGELKDYSFTSEDQIKERIMDCEIVITNKCKMNRETLNQTSVKLICLTATGTDNVDLDYCRSAGIGVCNVKGYSTQSVAMHTFTMLLYLKERIYEISNYTRTGEYIEDTSFRHLGWTFTELSGKTFGIVGMGAIGSKVAEIAKVFGCEVIYWSSSGKDRSSDYRRVDFETLLKKSHVISIHSPLNEKTRGIFNLRAFEKMQKDAYILNLGRGDIIDEKSLVKALENNLIAGAGVDVLSKEPMSSMSQYKKILNFPNFIITPHIAWAAKESRQRCMEEICLNIDSFIQGGLRNRS